MKLAQIHTDRNWFILSIEANISNLGWFHYHPVDVFKCRWIKVGFIYGYWWWE